MEQLVYVLSMHGVNNLGNSYYSYNQQPHNRHGKGSGIIKLRTCWTDDSGILTMWTSVPFNASTRTVD